MLVYSHHGWLEESYSRDRSLEQTLPYLVDSDDSLHLNVQDWLPRVLPICPPPGLHTYIHTYGSATVLIGRDMVPAAWVLQRVLSVCLSLRVCFICGNCL